jgi:hypothetical protein
VAVWTRQWCAPLHCMACNAWSVCSLFWQATAGAGRRESVRGRWARGEYDQLQSTMPGLVMPIGALANAQAASCGVRETQLQVHEPTDFSLCSVQCVKPQPGRPEWRKVEPPDNYCILHVCVALSCARPVAAGRLVRGDRK